MVRVTAKEEAEDGIELSNTEVPPIATFVAETPDTLVYAWMNIWDAVGPVKDDESVCVALLLSGDVSFGSFMKGSVFNGFGSNAGTIFGMDLMARATVHYTGNS